MKKAFKIGFIYFGVMLLALLATIIFCGAFLFFYREGNIFGIQYISTNEIIYAQETDDLSELQTIDISSLKFDVSVDVNKNVTSVVGAMHNKVFGYAKKSKAQAKFEAEYNNNTKTLTFSATEPKGWINRKGSYIAIAIPDEWVSNNYNIKVKTSKGDVSLGKNGGLEVASLNLESSKGNVVVSNTVISDDISLNCGKGIIYFDSKCSTVNEIDAQISVNSGTVNLTDIDTEKFKLGVVQIDKNTKGLIGIKKLRELKTGSNDINGGEIQVVEVDSVEVKSLDTDIKIVKINKSSRIVVTGSGKVHVKKTDGELTVEGHNGDVVVEQASTNLILSTNQGDISVPDATNYIFANSNYGNIDISFNGNAGDYSDATGHRFVTVKTQNGHIVVHGLQRGIVDASDAGRISLTYNKVVGKSEVTAKSGAVYIVVPESPNTNSDEWALNLYINSNVGADVKVGVGGKIEYDSTMNRQEYENIYNPNPNSSTSNEISVSSTTGKIKVRSSDLVNY